MEFKYTSLPRLKDKATTRLFLLLPGQGPLSIIFFEQILLNDEVENKYDVLSYCWSTDNDEMVITFDGASISIPTDLAQCLHQLRNTNHTRLLWAESICVNQDDLDEKAYQISIIGAIYNNAARVLAWLGQDHGPMTVSAFEFFARNAETKEHNSASRSTISQDAEIGVCDLLLRTWFKRVWATVAFALGRELLFLCGSHQASLDRLLQGTKFLTDSTKYDAGFATTHLARVRLLVQFRRPTAQRDLHTLLARTRQWYATDQRDKVFAMLAITTSPWRDLGLKLSYKTNCLTLYTRAALVIIVSEGRLAILNNPRSQQRKELPSWVPDWSEVDDHEEQLPPQFRSDADGLKPDFDDKRRVMRVQGVFAGRICTSGDILLPAGAKSREFFHYNIAAPEKVALWAKKFNLSVPTWTLPITCIRQWYKLAKTFSSPEDAARTSLRVNFYATIRGNQGVISATAGSSRWSSFILGAYRPGFDWILDTSFLGTSPIAAYLTYSLFCALVVYRDFFLLGYCSWASPNYWTDTLMLWFFPVIVLATIALAMLSWERDWQNTAHHLWYAHNRRFAIVSDQGRTYMALVPPFARTDDEIAILAGATNPTVLRKASIGRTTPNSYELIGQCYVHGLLDDNTREADASSSDIVRQIQGSNWSADKTGDGWKAQMIHLI